MTEQWRPIPGFPGYEASDWGRVRSVRKVLKPWFTMHGYAQVSLQRGPIVLKRGVHRLVLMAFCGDRPGLDACHYDGDKLNNLLTNLRWATRSENIRDQVRHGTHGMARKTHCLRGHEFSPENTKILTRGRRQCVACTRLRAREDYLKRKAAA